MDDEGEYEFQASGDACDVCQALDGTETDALPHDNCLCQIVPTERCEYNLELHPPVRHGPGNHDFFLGGDLTVQCPDKSEISESFEVDAAGFASGDWTGWWNEKVDAQVDELCKQCQPAADPNVA